MLCFLSCHILRSPLRAVGAPSCITTSSLISCFDALRSSWCKLFQHCTKQPSSFIRNDDAHHTTAWCALWHRQTSLGLIYRLSVSLFFFDLISPPLRSPPLLCLSFSIFFSFSLCPILLPFFFFDLVLISFFFISPPLPPLSTLVPLFSSALSSHLFPLCSTLISSCTLSSV